MKKINVLLVDDEDLFRQGLRALLEKEEFINEIFEASNEGEFNQHLTKPIHLILLDIKLKGKQGPELLAELVKKPDHPRVIALTGLEGAEVIIHLLKGGVNGIAFKLNSYKDIIQTILEVIDSGNSFSEKTLRIIQVNANRWDKIPSVSLSFKEKELLKAIATGLTTKAIAGELKMTEATTETYRVRLMKKLGVPNTAAMVAYAHRNGIL